MDIRSVKHEYSAASDWHDLLKVSDSDVGLTAFIAIHSTRNGPGFGGIRRMNYASEDAAVSDALRLSHHMTLKTAIAGLPCGGAKAVICARKNAEAAALYCAFGRAVEALNGQYYCGPDVGTGESEMAWVRQETSFANLPDNNPSESTAAGVLAGIRALINYTGESKPSTLVQGVGRVGQIVANEAAHFSSRVSISDINPNAVTDVASAIDVDVVPPEEVTQQRCILFSPCAVGPVVTDANVDQLSFQWICGSANNQLERPELAMALHNRGILYVPDIVVNAGAVIEGALSILEPGSAMRGKVADAINGIEKRVASLLAQSEQSNDSLLRLALLSATESAAIKTV